MFEQILEGQIRHNRGDFLPSIKNKIEMPMALRHGSPGVEVELMPNSRYNLDYA